MEQPRHTAATLESFRTRAREMLDALEEAVRPFPDLEDELEARRELEAKVS